jgi:hypothetical protein
MLGKVDELLEQDATYATPFIVGEEIKVIDGPFNTFTVTNLVNLFCGDEHADYQVFTRRRLNFAFDVRLYLFFGSGNGTNYIPLFFNFCHTQSV